MKKVKITVLKKDLYEDLVNEYGNKGLGKCSRFEIGQTFIITDCRQPEGFCNEGWASIRHYVFALSNGADGFWDLKDHISINTCNDGFRPVVFKIETLEDEIAN